MTSMPKNQFGFDLPIERVLNTDHPHCYRYAEDGENEEAFATRCAGNLRALIEEKGPNIIAALFAAPVMGAGGAVPPHATYFEKFNKS